jgi:hypothetical protein
VRDITDYGSDTRISLKFKAYEEIKALIHSERHSEEAKTHFLNQAIQTIEQQFKVRYYSFLSHYTIIGQM